MVTLGIALLMLPRSMPDGMIGFDGVWSLNGKPLVISASGTKATWLIRDQAFACTSIQSNSLGYFVGTTRLTDYSPAAVQHAVPVNTSLSIGGADSDGYVRRLVLQCSGVSTEDGETLGQIDKSEAQWVGPLSVISFTGKYSDSATQLSLKDSKNQFGGRDIYGSLVSNSRTWVIHGTRTGAEGMITEFKDAATNEDAQGGGFVIGGGGNFGTRLYLSLEWRPRKLTINEKTGKVVTSSLFASMPPSVVCPNGFSGILESEK